ncbi:M1 family metallopeptidase [Kordia sp. YSTF-M3]|uniref:M1 family metallopeptidase n=1 Tax=Kordia aestuariivivens TaxID=2759037 RepID=A0ABR7Q4M0_9FLAO|nr:M1 family metallopeptidase [Kordia aestuariivivens]MBC8753495.1 M1 family metallopeptidase [Kordia aestuariivivens]
MKRIHFYILALLFMGSNFALAQDSQDDKKEPGHTNNNKFKQLYQEFSTPNMYRTASGAPGKAYYQQQADYEMDIELDDKNKKLYGVETITYTNNSPDNLEYLWVQLDQNVRAKNSPARLKNGSSIPRLQRTSTFVSSYVGDTFDGGFNIDYVKDSKGKPMKYTINQTMMRIDLPKGLNSGDKISFSIKWWYNINNHVTNRGRSGYEFFEKDGNYAYVIAQFFPRMAVYNDVEGWQNYQFWGNGEFALPFGDYKVNITVPADHVLDATGKLQNRKSVFTKEMMNRFERAQESYDKPVIIVTQEEAEAAEKGFSTKKKTWKFHAENVRDFGFATSRKFIWDMQAVDINGKKVMAVSMYPKEGNPLWEEYSTKAVASTLKTFSNHTFTYPYHKAISVHAKNQGMEYPMICWNYGRPNEDGSYSERVKFGMISVIIHEVGHNFFPMIVNSDERQWGWMDEGLDTFMQYLAEQEFAKEHPESVKYSGGKYPSRRGEPSKIVPYMKGSQDRLSPIMSNPENVHQLGPNAYGKPATGLNILRETIMGPEAFDHAFKTYAQRWMFKHPSPEDFFRTMEDASGIDLDWFWRGWFYTTDYVDIAIEEVKKFQVGTRTTNRGSYVYFIPEGDERYKKENEGKAVLDTEGNEPLKEYLMDNFTKEERATMDNPKYFYEVLFSKPGGLVMPIIVECTYEDGTTELIKYPVQIWRKNDNNAKIVIASSKQIKNLQLDPKLETADIDTSNNTWPSKEGKTDFNEFKKDKMKQ